jgi:hypothetical protein
VRERVVQQNGTFFSAIAGFGGALAAVFAVIFYAASFAITKHWLSAQTSAALLGLYWVVSLILFAKFIADNFWKFYGAFVRRCRLYSTLRLLLQWYLLGSAFTVPVIAYVLKNYASIVESGLGTFDSKSLVLPQCMSFVLVVLFFSGWAKVVAWLRGTQSSKSEPRLLMQTTH